MEEVAFRFFRAIGFGAAAAAGLYFAGYAPFTAALLACVVAALFVLNILTYWAGTIAALLLVWGALVVVGIAPGVESVAALGNKAIGVVTGLKAKSDAAAPILPTGDETLAKKLESLKETCDKGLLTKNECEAAKAKIMSDFTK